ncbi:hypothetical protein PR048_005612 [Dryococelus australis]|uniref:Reverse transcriptase/retrotransposon-derived protein RNase H-like domain-containing protein n=1 Tax=Dryococelus australis TaxID=614101 RepID=A0ABQ9I9L7_9NEOP|nr:hypothetical protein PR048_005612 [Dryococelus australis]
MWAKYIMLFGWLHETIEGFVLITTPLTELMFPNISFKWKSTHEDSFDDLKCKFRECPTLARHEATRHFYVQMDVSENGLGVVLFQLADNCSRQTIDYSSTKFAAVERRYDVNDQECLAIAWAFKKYHQLLEFQRFTLQIGNKCLLFLYGIWESHHELTRFALFLQSYDFEEHHMAGEEDHLANNLSHSPGEIMVCDEEEWEYILSPPQQATHKKPQQCSAI